ncbi:CNH-domain-containing protein [Basidiobolus meristosporus CBS 931.73]|uniref:CNH-domain-containing protein n=1 Tax=Basidiobolus meristosporus CBS 931.73 TaxID=1314790 RepID=A0A1Y1Y093_9FUNG|nr:CNH-domain-containing protein [Basidiobolus meristosporus CBS 931.73]|eukprot:ORX91433.1 CNH-domain-containing protein [Basidiobolus meristosporus CBS 931.73]
MSIPKKKVVIYPALLSRVAEVFREKIVLQNHVKDSLEYKNCFTGREAVDIICYIIRNSDRNLALLLGRALDAQKMFHDVTYEHRLRDSLNELYMFDELISTSYDEAESDRNSLSPEDTASEPPVNGVFTLLASCYSPTCSRDRLCYSIACPRRLEQQARLNMTPSAGLKRTESRSSLQDKQVREQQDFWINSVPKEIVDSVSKEEQKRQEIIFEVIYTERDFVRDLEILNELYMAPLMYGSVIEETRRESFGREVFFNVMEVYSVGSKLSDDLIKRQNERAVVERIGDVFLKHVGNFKPFVSYGAHQIYSKHCLELESKRNHRLAKFLEERERLPESRKLPIYSFLGRPTTRLGRYPLLLEAVIKHTPDGHPDKRDLPIVIEAIKELLSQVNTETGRADNKLRLTKLNDALFSKNGDIKELRLLDENRQLIRDGPIKKRSGVEQVELTMFLFDHALLLTKKKKTKDSDFYEYKVHKKPIPLELLALSSTDEVLPRVVTRRSSAVLGHLPGAATPKYISDIGKGGYPLTITHLGKNGGSHTLYAASQADLQMWKERIEQQRALIAEKKMKFELDVLTDITFTTTNRVTCSAVVDFSKTIVIGAEDGIYAGIEGSRKSFKKIIEIERVSQIAVLESYNILLVLADKVLVTFPLATLDSMELVSIKRARKISSHVSFFKVGVCLGKTLVCVVKSTALSSTIKTYEPIPVDTTKKKSSLGKLLIRSSGDGMKVYKEFYIPTESSSVHFLRSKLCVGCTKGFEIVDLESLNTQDLLDPADENLNFVLKRENIRPISIFRIRDGDFLLCYDEFAFYVNKNGRRSRPNFIINWEGAPSAFALQYPYAIAFDPSFIEIRHIETGELAQVIVAKNLRPLCIESNTVHCVADSILDYQSVSQLKLRNEESPDVPVNGR